jgi:replicative superfamily II helicase
MPRSVDDVAQRIHEATRPGFRGRLVARGLARNLIWSDGKVPTGSQEFSPLLSADLLSYGLALFKLGLEIRGAQRDHEAARTAFERAGEAIESVIRDGDPAWNDRGFYTVVASAAYHLGHFSARAFSLFPSQIETLNLSPTERAVAFILRRDLEALRAGLLHWVASGGGFDATLAARFETTGDDLNFDAALTLSLNSLFYKALAFFDYALDAGSAEAVGTSLNLLNEGIAAATEFNSVPFWWIFTISRHLLDDLWGESLHVRLPNPIVDQPGSDWRNLRRLFIAELQRKDRAEIDLWPSQVDAAQRAMNMDDDLIAALPTSAGKTRIAEICILRALSLKRRVVFVTPLRALSAQTERTLRRTFTPLGFSVSSLYGSSGATGDDVDSLRNRDIVVSTPEKLDFALRNNPALLDDVGLIVLDEAHTIGAGEREIRYEVLVQRLLRRADAATRRIVCLSAILPQGEQLQDFVSWIRQDQEGKAITRDWRPTRQRFGEIVWLQDRARLNFRVDGEAPFVDPFVTLQPPLGRQKKSFPSDMQELTFASAWRLVDEGQTVLIYCPLRISVNSMAKKAVDLNQRGYLKSLLKVDAAVLNDALNIGREWLGQFHPAVECLRFGVAVHHANLPRPFLRAVEQLLQSQILKITIASPTLAQGLNLTATTVLFYSLMRNRKTIPGEEFANVAGRAGRAFVDVEGQVLCVATESKQLKNWDKLLKAAKERDMRSGLFQLVQEFCRQLAVRKGYSAAQIIEYVTGNVAAWEPPQPARTGNKEEQKAQEDFERKWLADLACLDSALLSLVQHDISLTELAKAVDEALQSSLWQRTLRREDETSRKLSEALLLGRANFIWRNSTAVQRKGYFFAGVSFTTGRYLDEHAAELSGLLQSADKAFDAGNIDEAFRAVIHFADRVFVIEPFKPKELPENWDDILWAWMCGESMADLAGGKDAAILEFIEGALVYRLVWAMEAVRVRTTAVTGEEDQPHAGRAALAIETGTSDFCASLLIQSGVPSRIAAMKAVRDCPAAFHDVKGLRVWLKSEPVTARQRDPDWPTPETANLWREFVKSFENPALRRWDIHKVEFPVAWETPPPPAGVPVRVLHDANRRETVIYSVALDRIGVVTPSFLREPKGIILGQVSSSSHRVFAEYLGPRDLVSD